MGVGCDFKFMFNFSAACQAQTTREIWPRTHAEPACSRKQAQRGALPCSAERDGP
jgi:hypothetical protein